MEVESGILDQTAKAGEDPLDEDDALESIFTAQIAGLAGMMQRILAEKKAKDSRGSVPDSKVDKQRAREKSQVPQAPVTATSKDRPLSPAQPRVDAPANDDCARKESGLVQSRWSLAPSSAPALSIQNAHHDIDESFRFSSYQKRSEVAGSPASLPKTTRRTVTPLVAAQESAFDGNNDAPVYGMNGLDRGNAATSASRFSTPSYWW